MSNRQDYTMPQVVAWIRTHPDGSLTRELLTAIETVRMTSGAWVPLVRLSEVQDEIASLQARLDAAEKDAARYRSMLLDLLATIHGDGGHYVDEHGLDKAWQDAIQLSAERGADAQRLAALVCALKTHSGDSDGWEFGLGRVRFENGKPAEFLWATQADIGKAVASALAAPTTPAAQPADVREAARGDA